MYSSGKLMNLQSKDQSTLRFKWMLAGFALFGLPILVGLGCWQLQRADQKQQLLDSMQQAEPLHYLPLSETLSSVQYSMLLLQGRLDQRQYFLLDNRTRDGRVGYEVIALFQPLQEAHLILVNLGWTPAGNSRDELPNVDLPSGVVSLALMAKAQQSSLVLARDQWAEGWPKRIQAIDTQRIEVLLQQPVWHATAKTRESVVDDLDIRWTLNLMTPERHRGYAFQWFALDTALLILLVVSWFRLQGEKHHE